MENLTAVKTKWVLDKAHSELLFKVKHLMISNVKGSFTNFDVDVEGEDFETAKVTATIDSSSISTNNADRDGHLKSADFFDSENYPEITFRSLSIQRTATNRCNLNGELTIKGFTHPVTLDVELGGINKDPWGNEKAGFSFSASFNRKDWGLNWNAALETGGVLVSDEVHISGEIQFLKKN